MANIVCKFKLGGIKRVAGGGMVDGKAPVLTDLEFYPVSSGSEENKTFWKYTPSGKLEFQTVNDEAVQMLDLGKEYYIIITDQKPTGL